FTPVLIQRMIGESNPQALPKCGVMFTEDCQSKIATLDSSQPTSGITVVQAAYGHNEGVVSSLIPVDSYYINQQHNIIPIIRPKTHRMMPTEISGELKLVANNSRPAVTPSLNAGAVISLKNFAEKLEQFYGGPMDVEFVVNEEENTVYIVQARPLVARKFEEAMYLQNQHLLQGEVLKGSTIGAAGGSLRLVKPSQIVFGQTLGEALDKYQELQNPQEIEAIVTGRHAPSTSHWATVFHNEGKPVLHLPQLDNFQSWLQNPDASILVSPQQGMAINLKFEKEPTLENLQASNIAVKGWVDYPAAPLISASLQFQPKEKLTNEAIKALYPPLSNNEKWLNFQKYAGQFDFKELLQQLHLSQGEDLQIGLAALLYKFKSVPVRHAGTLELDPEQKQRLEALQSYAFMLAKDILENVHANQTTRPFAANYCL
ncbi:MAG: hypothetical protein H0U49_03725, partial [Parachlamydiaceae bacterium]|nr:hypothetical protein [Parachlamydiaceae bacterium]